MEKPQADYSHFSALDIRVGTILRAEDFEKATNPAYKLWIDFGELGELKSSAQITELYNPTSIVGKQIIAVVNFPVKQIADFMSECLVLGTIGENGVTLIQPGNNAVNGEKIG